MICLNLTSAPTLGFFVDGFVHQGGHILLSEATLDRDAFFKLAPDELVGSITKSGDGRSVYELLHGLYTEYAVLQVLSRIVQRVALTDHDRIEFRGRLAHAFRSMTRDLELASSVRERIFSEEGEKLLRALEVCHAGFRDECLATDLDISDQSGDFDAETFLSKNRSGAHI
jgi:hypothetical protein